MTRSRRLSRQQVHKRFSPLVVMFGLVALAIGILIFYIAFSKTIITIVVNDVPKEFEFSYAVDSVDPQVFTTEVELESTFNDFQEATTASGTAGGVVTIYNNYSADQPLVRTTRLLSTEGVLFRTAETVTVPAGGSAEVEVYADVEGETGDIPASRFEIVALWEGLKEDIYAESVQPMTGGVVKTGVVTDKTIQQAERAALTAIKKQAIADFENQANVTRKITADSLLVTIHEQTITPEAGTEANAITVNTSATVAAYIFDERKIKDLLVIETGRSINQDLKYSLISRNGKTYIDGNIALAETLHLAEEIDMTQLTSKSEEHIKAYLDDFEQVKKVEVKFSPFWLRTSPPRPANIELNIVQ